MTLFVVMVLATVTGNPSWCSHHQTPFSNGLNFASCSAYVGCNTVGGSVSSSAEVCASINSQTLNLSATLMETS